MKNNRRILTVTQFAKEVDVSRATVINWILSGRMEGLTRYGSGPYLIPDTEHNLSLRKLSPGRRKRGEKKEPIPFSSVEEAREKFNFLRRWSYERKMTLTYDELLELFDGDATFQEIAEIVGVKRQRVHQIYDEYFKPFMASGRDRRKVLFRQRWRERAENHPDTVERLSLVKKVAEDVGFKVEAVQSPSKETRYYMDRVLINGKLCRIFFSKVAYQIVDGYRAYHRLNVSRSAITTSDFIVIMTGENARRTFVFPSDVLLSHYKEDQKHKMFYLPTDPQEPYNNQFPKIDWWRWEEAWSLLEDLNASTS